MDDDKRDDESWAKMMVRLAVACGRKEPDQKSAEYGERLLAAARAVSRGKLS